MTKREHMISSWVEMTKLLSKIETKFKTTTIKSISIERSHLQYNKHFDVSVHPSFQFGDFTILAAKIKGKT